ncbi:MAG: cupin domain-containing protein [Saccharolobus sp.]|uniref:cupin domain-containing protein n=1 Tax=Saccharolobus TaxID=2100760 RepID=UPI001F0D966D|nr:cupin domain-containing protein [Saccharolobus shibatae]MCH4815819.1 cupin domain-containing protein [Saccharolobus shibatae]
MSNELEQRRQEFFKKLLSYNLTTYFITFHPTEAPKFGLVKRPIFTNEPTPLAIPFKWDYATLRKLLYELAELLRPEEAERRQVQLVNPGLKELPYVGVIAISPTIFAAIQLVKAGEVAPSHYHTPNAFRFILEAPPNGAYTIVNGRRIIMHRGDVVLTPSWSWHDHRNEGESDVIWLDGLDAPLIWYMGGIFYKNYSEIYKVDKQPITHTEDDILTTYGSGLKPEKEDIGVYNPLLYYPYFKAKEGLTKLSEKSNVDETEGIVLRYINPLNGEDAFPTMSLKIRMIKPKSQTLQIKKTEHIVFVGVEGYGTIEVKGQKFSMRPNDIVIIPPWENYRIVNSDEKPLILFSYSDEPLFRKVGIYREQISK